MSKYKTCATDTGWAQRCITLGRWSWSNSALNVQPCFCCYIPEEREACSFLSPHNTTWPYLCSILLYVVCQHRHRGGLVNFAVEFKMKERGSSQLLSFAYPTPHPVKHINTILNSLLNPVYWNEIKLWMPLNVLDLISTEKLSWVLSQAIVCSIIFQYFGKRHDLNPWDW